MRSLSPSPLHRAAATLALLVAPLAGCHDASPPTAPQALATPVAPLLAVITTSFTDLGTFGGTSSSAESINDLGQITGSWQDADGVNHGYLWANGLATDLALPFASQLNSPRDIDNLGRVVGRVDRRASLWENGGITQLDDLAAGPSSANAINDLGQIVGRSANAAGESRAVLWTDGVPADLGTLGGDESDALDINEGGQIVGVARNGSGDRRPTLWSNGTAVDLGTLGGATGLAIAINELGQIVGSSTTGPTDVTHATLWQNGSIVDLGTLGGELSQASAINDLGQIVGVSTDAGGTALHVVLWMDGSMYQLGQLSATTLNGALAINNLGEVAGFSGTPGRAVRWQVAIRAVIDVMPGDATNTIKSSGAGTVSVAVLGSRWFDVTQIDARTVTLGNENGIDTPVARKKNGQPEASLRDVNRDGYLDLALTFDKKRMTTNGDLALSASQLVLLGTRLDGRRVRGVDRVAVQ